MVGFFNTLARKQCFLPSENFDFRNPERCPYTVQFMPWRSIYRDAERETVCNNIKEEDYDKRERQRGKKCKKFLGFKNNGFLLRTCVRLSGSHWETPHRPT